MSIWNENWIRTEKSLEIATVGTATLIAVLIFVVIYGISWLVTCGIIKLITMCFGWTFKWSISTGIWLVLCVTKSVFGSKE